MGFLEFLRFLFYKQVAIFRKLQQPNVILPAIHDGCHIDSVFLYLIKSHIMLAKQQLAVFLKGYRVMFQPWIALRHRGKAVGHFNKGIYQLVSSRYADIGKKTRMGNKHIPGGFRNFYRIRLILFRHRKLPRQPCAWLRLFPLRNRYALFECRFLIASASP